MQYHIYLFYINFVQVRNTIKDIVLELASEDEIQSDKFGVSTFYWSFPGTASKMKSKRLETIKQQIEQAQKKIESNIKMREENFAGREETDERKEKLKEWSELKAENARLEEEIRQNAGNDPVIIENMGMTYLFTI